MIQGVDIPTIKDSAIRCLRKRYDETLKNCENVKRFKEQVSSELAKISSMVRAVLQVRECNSVGQRSRVIGQEVTSYICQC